MANQVKRESCHKEGQVVVEVNSVAVNSNSAAFEGKEITLREYRILRRFKDINGDWKESSSFSFRDLGNLANILATIMASTIAQGRRECGLEKE